MTISAEPATAEFELDILRYGLIEVAREMNEALMRSAFSPVCRDILDCTTAIHVRSGDAWETAAQWEGCMQHAFTSPHIVNFVMDEFDVDSLQPGDVIFVNDPWRGTIHQSDVNLLRPVFVDGRVEFMLPYLSGMSAVREDRRMQVERVWLSCLLPVMVQSAVPPAPPPGSDR
ncbi:hydantoinase B/oxoprolinase family protein [Amycolatopsis echigonensis]|uniref:hydantoinase B/oxoprolinase family protein n=1 Tax=Amycolatopsis echigonensis TaxID=2576905 RepID=UPI001ABF42DE|nr:hydantoinase B/oxoprolinase family protein [Amycolatopsis niigatensis]